MNDGYGLSAFDELDAFEFLDTFADADLADEEDDFKLDDEGEWGDAGGLGEALRTGLSSDYDDALPEDLDAVVEEILGTMSPAESFNFAKALGQIQRGAIRALSDPFVARIARTALPLASGAAGTLIGGPAGTAVGSALGNAALRALPAGRPPTGSRPPAPALARAAASAPTAQVGPVSSGSTAAAQGLVLTQKPEVLESLLALAFGAQGRQSINGVPVGAVMNMLSSIFGRAAADAEELYNGWRLPEEGDDYPEGIATVSTDRLQALYGDLIDTENERLAQEAWRDDD